jgi:hypothetical protein
VDASAGLASHARKEDEGWTKKPKAQTEGLAEIISDFFNSIGQGLPSHPRTRSFRSSFNSGRTAAPQRNWRFVPTAALMTTSHI